MPGGGGYQVCGLYDVVPAKFGQGQLAARRPSNYGSGRKKTSDFFTGSVATRFGSGIELGGSLDTGRTVDDQCFVVDSPQSLLNCHVETPFAGQTQIKIFGSYPVKGGLLVSTVFQNTSGVSYQANYQVPNSAIAPSLGRNLAACGSAAVCNASVTVPLIPPNTYFEPRRTLVDLRLSKIFSVGGSRNLRANFDIYNVFNAAHAIGVNNTYGSTWLRPVGNLAITVGRLLQFGGQLSF